MRFFVLVGLCLLLAFQYRYWFGASGYFAVAELAEEVARQERLTARLEERNRVLRAEVDALKSGLDAVEARARTDLGMIREGESFYVVVDPARGER